MMAHLSNPYFIEEVGSELLTLPDSLQKDILDLKKKLRRHENYREMHVILSKELGGDLEKLRTYTRQHVTLIQTNICQILEIIERTKTYLQR